LSHRGDLFVDIRATDQAQCEPRGRDTLEAFGDPFCRRTAEESGRAAADHEFILGVARGEKTVDLGGCMKSAPEPSTQEVLAGLVERVTFHNAENGFCVLWVKARGHQLRRHPRGSSQALTTSGG
jgi:hypothetical protein